MNNIYLQRIELENFRTFGVFSANLPAAPGLTLLVGTNGLGKSSFFDGIEWGLTGSIRRFKSYLPPSTAEGAYLTRRGAPSNSHAVKLTFDDGAPLTRTWKGGPLPSQIISLLKKSEWGAQIEDISTYLAFTHFLGQAAQQRFTSRDKGEQWESLKGPSGIDRLEEVRSTLRGRSTQNAFRRRIEAESAEVQRIAGQLADWQSARSRLVRLRQTAGATGAISGADLNARIDKLIVKLSQSSGQDDLLAVSAGAPARRLLALRDLIESERAEAANGVSRLTALSDVVTKYLVVKPVADPTDPGVRAARSAAEVARTALAKATRELRDAQAELRRLTTEAAAIEGEITLLSAAREDAEKVAVLTAERAALTTEITSVNVAIEASQKELATLEQTIERGRAQHAAFVEVGTAEEEARAIVDKCEELARSEALAAEVKPGADAAAVAAEQARRLHAELILERDRLAAKYADAERRLALTKARASELAAAVARIASHLGPHDKYCPVCTTPFDPADLKRLAGQAAVSQNAELAAIEIEHASLILSISRVQADLSEAEATIASAELAAQKLADAQSVVVNLRRSIGAALGGERSSNLASFAKARETAAIASTARLRASISAAEKALREAVENRPGLLDTIAAMHARRLQKRERLEDVERAIRGCVERLAARGHSESGAAAITLEVAAQGRALAGAQDRQLAGAARVEAALTSEAFVRQQAQGAEANLMRANAAVDTATKDAAALEGQWTRAGLSGAPMVSTLENARSVLTGKLADLNTILEEQSSLANANEALTHFEELTALIRQMEVQGGKGAADSPETFEATLAGKLKRHTAAQKQSETAQIAVNALADRLQNEAREFSTRFLVPLNDLIDDFNEALLSTPGESIRFNAAHHVDTTRFDMRLRFRDPLEEALYKTELPPQVILSEGQLAANGFSILCAASTAYPWSRWRALLLDDPLQHNDIIHTAAFVDVMRNLVELQGYQLLMSSHDRAEGEFIARKFDAAGLPCTILALTAPSKDGVRFDPPRYNGPAQRYFDGALVKSG
jgi:DNA repair exonuclease SbcCD ATPase subunit